MKVKCDKCGAETEIGLFDTGRCLVSGCDGFLRETEQPARLVDDPARRNVLRIVFQITDTPKNRSRAVLALAAIKCSGDIEGFGVLKLEKIQLLSIESTVDLLKDIAK